LGLFLPTEILFFFFKQYASACFTLSGMHLHDKKLIIFRPRTVATRGLCGPDS